MCYFVGVMVVYKAPSFADMQAANVVCPKCEQIVSLATLNPGDVFAASLQLQELAGVIASTDPRFSQGRPALE
jgi:hypothetical protein